MDWTNFDIVFRSKPDYSLDQKQTDAITRNRKELGGILFFDRIWSTQKAYPPKSNAELRSVWQKVAKAEVSDEKKQAVLFYILKDCRQLSNAEPLFAQKVYLPLKYQILVAGLWELDHLQFSRALEHLSDPSLTPEFADDILLTLLTASQCESTLAMAYYLTVQPPLMKQETLEIFFSLLVENNIMEAYRFCSKKETSVHKKLFEELLRSVHEENPSAAKAERMITLLGIPFTAEEGNWFEEYLLRGPGSRINGAKDSVIIRRLTTGRAITGVGTLDRHRGQKLDDINWDGIRTLTKSGVA